jgi:hypothetical protein
VTLTDAWIAEFLADGPWPDTSENIQFVRSWSVEEASSCKDNPLIASRVETGSSDCKTLSSGRVAQNYDSVKQGQQATAAQINSGNFDNLRRALASGNPYTQARINGVALDLQKWGATTWQAVYLAHWSGTTISGGTGHAPHAMGAWSRWMRALSHQLPADIREINRATHRLDRIARHR